MREAVILILVVALGVLRWQADQNSARWEQTVEAALQERNALRAERDSLLKVRNKVLTQVRIHHDTVLVSLQQLELDTTTADSLKSCMVGFNACQQEAKRLWDIIEVDSLALRTERNRVTVLEGLLEKRPQQKRFSIVAGPGLGGVLSGGKFYVGPGASVILRFHF